MNQNQERKVSNVEQLMAQVFEKSSQADRDATLCRLKAVHPDAAATSEGFEYQMRGVGALSETAKVSPLFADATVGSVQSLLLKALMADQAALDTELTEASLDGDMLDHGTAAPNTIADRAADARPDFSSMSEADLRSYLKANSLGRLATDDPLRDLLRGLGDSHLEMIEIANLVFDRKVVDQPQNWFKGTKVPEADDGVYLLKSGKFSRFWMGQWRRSCADADSAAKQVSIDAFPSPQFRVQPDYAWTEMPQRKLAPAEEYLELGAKAENLVSQMQHLSDGSHQRNTLITELGQVRRRQSIIAGVVLDESPAGRKLRDLKPDAEGAQLFFEELLSSVETLEGIAEQYGVRTLTDIMYLQQAILKGETIEVWPGETEVGNVLQVLPSAIRWMQHTELGGDWKHACEQRVENPKGTSQSLGM